MKKFTTTLAATALILTGCSQNEVIDEVAQNQPIEFGTYAGRPAQTRATSIPAKPVSMGVFAYYTGQSDWDPATHNVANFMKNQKVTLTDGNYTYSPIKYWPNNPGDKVSFFAYAPYNANASVGSYTTNGFTLTGFTVTDNVKTHQDLLYVKDNKTLNLERPKVTDKVTFNFAHALARIGFSATFKVDDKENGTGLDDNTKITINRVALSSANGTDKLFYSSGDLSVTKETSGFKINWNNYSGNDQRIASFTLNTTKNNFGTEGNVLQTKVDPKTSKINQLNGNDSFIMIIPQNLTETDITITVEYEVETTDTNLPDNKSTITNTISNTLKGFNFEAGKAYTYNLILGLTSVKIDATSETWTDVAAQNVDLPKNTTTTTTE